MNIGQGGRSRAIFIAGSPGAGKSTLSSFLARQLTLYEIPVRLFHEHDFAHVDVMARFRKEWYFGDRNTMASWLEATSPFFDPCLASDEVWVLDALYPGFFSLLGLYSPAEVAGFADALATILQPVHPLIVYLSGDPRVFMERATARRGTGWRDAYARYVQNWHLERYPGGSIGGVDDVIRLFEWRHRHVLELLARWPGETLILDAVHTPLHGLERALLERVGIQEMVEEPVPPEVLQGYVGVYAPTDPDASSPLIVDLVDGQLRINAYWDAGCPLVPEGEDTFRLEATEQVVTFIREPDGTVQGLRYAHDGKTDQYRRTF